MPEMKNLDFLESRTLKKKKMEMNVKIFLHFLY